MDNNSHTLQAILYANGGEMKKSELASLMQISQDELTQHARELEQSITDTGLDLIITETSLSLRSAAKYAEYVTELQKTDSEKDIGTAGLEVLSIVLYKEAVSRAVIDYIRGVNSSGTLRQLVLRGLLERKKNQHDARAWVYTATPELFAYVGITTGEQLPDYETLATALRTQQEEIPNE